MTRALWALAAFALVNAIIWIPFAAIEFIGHHIASWWAIPIAMTSLVVWLILIPVILWCVDEAMRE